MTARQRFLELFIQVMIFYSIAVHFIEIEFADSDANSEFFLWSERVVATVFTVEYLVRWIGSRSLLYPFRLMAIVDLLAILPFYVSFAVDLRSLRLIRTLRVLRLFKLSRHNQALQNLLHAFHRIRYEFGIIGFAVLVVVWCSSLAIYELERERQPVVFGKLSDAVWFVLSTVTTVGYGDKVPVTAGGKIVAGGTMVAGLALFGAFISLIGSAFLQEIHASMHHQPGETEGANPNREGSVPERLQTITQERFDPRQVLQALDAGALQGAGGLVHLEALRLLTLACRLLASEGKPPSASGLPPAPQGSRPGGSAGSR